MKSAVEDDALNALRDTAVYFSDKHGVSEFNITI